MTSDTAVDSHWNRIPDGLHKVVNRASTPEFTFGDLFLEAFIRFSCFHYTVVSKANIIRLWSQQDQGLAMERPMEMMEMIILEITRAIFHALMAMRVVELLLGIGLVGSR